MLMITITNWKQKCAVILKLLFFLLLIGLIIPQFLSFIAAEIGDIDKKQDLMKVENSRVLPAEESSLMNQLRQLYSDEEQLIP
ncbi:MAG: hypothetical protein WBJ83_06690 [Thermacetogeniaceae bacterium]|jgi:hypothetical protein|nr:hypothetical protein [Syntrophomonadaceae bacterium]